MSETSSIVDPNQIITGVATELAKNAAVSFWDKVKKFFRDLDAEDQIRYGEAYEEYLSNTKSKYSQIKTLIYRKVPKNLESFYECTGVQYDWKRIDTSNVANLLNLGNKIVVTGTGGIGKSMLFKYLFLHTIKETDYIPILLELRSLNSIETQKINLFRHIYSILTDNGFSLEEEYFEKSMKDGGYVILFDGFDELSREKAEVVGSEIKRLTDHFNKNHFVISSRPMDEFIGWNDFCEVSVCPLTKKQAINLIQKIEYDESVKDKFLFELDENLYDKYRSFASNPLLLTIMLMTFSNHASIPEYLNDFYEQAFATLYNMHDATKDCYTRDIRTGLGCEEFKTIFAYICFKTYFNNEYGFSEYQIRSYIEQAKSKFSRMNFTVNDYMQDLILSVCMLIKDGLSYRFVHRSFQEYFAALHTCKLMDEDQKSLLSAWLDESDAVIIDQYLKMLFDMQPDKVNKLIFCPGIKKIKNDYDAMGFTLDFIKMIYSGVVFRKGTNNYIKYNLLENDKYKYNIVYAACNLNEFIYRYRIDAEIQRKLNGNKKLQSMLKNNRIMHCSFQDTLDIIPKEELINILKREHQQLLFCFSILEKYSGPVRRKKKLSKIIDEL